MKRERLPCRVYTVLCESRRRPLGHRHGAIHKGQDTQLLYLQTVKKVLERDVGRGNGLLDGAERAFTIIVQSIGTKHLGREVPLHGVTHPIWWLRAREPRDVAGQDESATGADRILLEKGSRAIQLSIDAPLDCDGLARYYQSTTFYVCTQKA